MKCHLDERHSYSILLDVVFNGVAHSHDELVRDHEDQDVGSLHRLSQVRNSQLMKKEGKHGESSSHRATSTQSATSYEASEAVLILTTLGGSL